MVPAIRVASHLWIEAGAMSGPPDHRHQVEFADDVAQFFDDAAREDEVLLMRTTGGPFWPRPLTYRGTDYGQWTEIWRLGLLTTRMGGPDYAGRILHITRVRIGGNVAYELEVADAGSATAQRWSAEAAARGGQGVTGGPNGREFGYW